MTSTKTPDKKYLDFSFKLLTYRPRSEHEIRFRLQRKGASSTTIDKIIVKLKKLKFINDAEFVHWWQSQRDQFKPRSAKILKFELIQKKIPPNIIQSNLDTSHQKELTRANSAFKKKFKLTKSSASYAQRQKMISFLSRRGFSWEIIKSLLPQITYSK